MKLFYIFLIFVLYNTSLWGKGKDIVDYVNPIIGASSSQKAGHSAHGLGKTFPGVTTPFGLVQLSPDTKTGGDNGAGYSWHDNTIEGFSFIHMSGIGWYGEFGNLLVTPTVGPLHTFVGVDNIPLKGYRSHYFHNTEIAKVGYYAVTLADYNIRTELTAAKHAGFIRLTYPQNDTSRISFDLARRIGGSSTEQYIKVINDNTIQGWMLCTSKDGGWGNGKGNVNYTVYFYCQFNKPLRHYGVWSTNLPKDMNKVDIKTLNDTAYCQAVASAQVIYGCREYKGRHLGFFNEFPTYNKEQLLIKVGISFVSMEGAKRNLENDIKDWNFENVYKKNRIAWNKALSNIQVNGSNHNKTVFYSSLYHTMIDPRDVSDVTNQYIGGDNKIHVNKKYVYRSIFSGWDVFRAQFPLQTIINPQMVNDEINSLICLAQYSKKEYFPRWEIMNSYSGCMLGNPAVSIIVDAYKKGIRNWDIMNGYAYCKKSIEHTGNGVLGYTPLDISRTLEYSYADWCFSEFASALGRKKDEQYYRKRSLNYKNLWNDSIKWFCGKNSDGSWGKWKSELTQNLYSTESNPLQQGWFVPHDVYGLINLIGKNVFVRKLTDFFNKSPETFLWNDYYNHANEPVHHVPFLFTYTGNAWLTQKWTLKICSKAYGTDVYGLCGNEDVGQMSAWYVLASIGIYPVNPGDNIYILTSPVFNKITIHLDNKYYKGVRFTIKTYNNSPKNCYIQSVKLNKKTINRLWIMHKEITNGGIIEIIMGNKPNKYFGEKNLPPSLHNPI